MCEPNANGERRGERPNLSDIFSNLRSGGQPWYRTLATIALNKWRKLKSRQNCCGNLGAPGC